MRFIKQFNDGEEDKLRNILKNFPLIKARIRANAILLSSKSISIAEIADVLDVHRDTVSNWLRNWENKGMMGLFDEAKPGRPRAESKLINEN